MKFIGFSGSLRTESLNKTLLRAIKNILTQNPDHDFIMADLKELSIPVYDGDVEAQGLPKGVLHLAELISQSDALILSTPEYNNAIAGPLKNTIDWLSRVKPNPFTQKPTLITGTSPGGFAAIQGLADTRKPFLALGAYVYPQNFGLAKGHENLHPEGRFTDPQTEKRMTELLQNFSRFAQQLQRGQL